MQTCSLECWHLPYLVPPSYPTCVVWLGRREGACASLGPATQTILLPAGLPSPQVTCCFVFDALLGPSLLLSIGRVECVVGVMFVITKSAPTKRSTPPCLAVPAAQLWVVPTQQLPGGHRFYLCDML